MHSVALQDATHELPSLSLSPLSLFFSPSLSLPQREFEVEPYMHRQNDIGHAMRTILVDWLIEVQENFELFHETLYLGVKLVDIYLSRKEVLREYLQLVGATCLLIASKFEVTLKFVQDFAHEIFMLFEYLLWRFVLKF